MSVAKMHPKLGVIPVPVKAPVTMTIMDRRAKRVAPKGVSVAPGQPVELKADDDCEVVFDRGIGLILKKNHSQLVMFVTDGIYHFQVQYLVSTVQPTPIKPRRLPPQPPMQVIATQTVLMAAHSVSGPTGDIHVP